MSKKIFLILAALVFVIWLGMSKGIHYIPEAKNENLDWKKCLTNGGSLSMFPSSAVDACLPHGYDPYSINFGGAARFTLGCKCGKNKCWTGSSCRKGLNTGGR